MSNDYRVTPLARPFDVEIALPGSKSVANRAIVAACLAQGCTIIHGATPVDDVRHLVEALARLGFRLRWIDEDAGRLEVWGGLPTAAGAGELYCGNAGTAVRFVTSVAALVPGEWIVTGDARMRQRPIGDLVLALRALGADVAATDGCPPVRIRGGWRRGGQISLRAAVSSQFVSSLLLVGACLDGGLAIGATELSGSAGYIELTRTVLARFGVVVTGDATGVLRVAQSSPRSPTSFQVEADHSAAGAFLVLAELTSSRFAAPALDPHSAQGDRAVSEVIAMMRGAGPRTIDVREIPDQLMNLAVLAARRDGDTRFVGAARLRVKETDRLAVTAQEFAKAGLAIEVEADGVLVRGGARLRPARLDPHGDHRMAMAFAILGSLVDGVVIDDPVCVSKSYPGFFRDLAGLPAAPRCVAIIGMRGAGKSTLARQVAADLQLTRIDCDEEFERRHGAIGAFVAAHGFARFRELEAQRVAEALHPGRVVALGGGAIETPRVRDLLRDHAVVVWIDEERARIEERVAGSDRPVITPGGDLRAEIEPLLARRRPLYQAAADLRLPPGRTPQQWSADLRAGLQRLARGDRRLVAE